MTRTKGLLLVYLLAVLTSRLWISWGPMTATAPEGSGINGLGKRQSISLELFDRGTEFEPAAGREFDSRRSDGSELQAVPRDRGEEPRVPVRLAYQTLGPPAREAIVLLHGSPGSLQDFDRLGTRLDPERYVLIPDMLGFGHSERNAPDYSFVAQADYLLQLLDRLGVERAHLVAFSWGGGVALELAARAPERVSTIAMVSAIGVQELELLGRYELNRLVHAFQHGGVVALDWLIPHFGALSRGPFGRGFTRSFLDSDQRPFRAVLSGFEKPMLILHGENDFLVPAKAAEEHHRLVPQSEIRWFEGGHLVLWSHPDEVVAALTEFFDRAEQGVLLSRSQADPQRVAQAAVPFDRELAGPQNGLGWTVFALLVFVASMVSEDLTCAGVGLLVATGQVGFVGGVLACVFALVLGDLVLYAGGRLVGPPLLRRLGRDPSEIGPVAERLRTSGGVIVLLGRFVPGARLPTYVAAGVLKTPILRLTAWLVLAALLWAPLLVGLAAAGGRALEMQDASPVATLWWGAGLIVTMGVLARLVPRLFRVRDRRLLWSKVRRLLRWEFWPIWAIYGTLAPSLIALAMRHRSLRLPTLVNPPIPGGGLAGESKAELEEVLGRVSAHAIPTEILEPAPAPERVEQVEAFMRRGEIDYPIVLKPDIGERGRGVEIVQDAAAMHRYLDRNQGRTLAQAYVPGDEFGLFYTRLPGAERGELFSIARKTPRSVVGDGKGTLESLILYDEICVPMAEKLLTLNEARLSWVPASGEAVQVTPIGTHSLGCRFLVGEDLRSSALEAAVDRLSQSAGLDFGRYDVRAPDEAAISRGEFQVIEFNGLTGEAAHMYDPRYGLWQGLSILRAQWRRAFEIGAGHRAEGRRPLPWRDLVRLVLDSRESA